MVIENQVFIIWGLCWYPGQICQMSLKRTTFSNTLSTSTVINHSTRQPITTKLFQGIQSDVNGFILTPPGWVKFWIVCVVSGRSWFRRAVCACVSVQVLLRRWGFSLFCLIYFITSGWFRIFIFRFFFLHLHLLL